MVPRQVELAELLDSFVAEHVAIRRGDPFLLGHNAGPASHQGPGGFEYDPARVTRLFVEELRRSGFRVVDDLHPEETP